ncbi:MAG: hypothetical protein IJU76_12210 [Desulfovibrionaceae bacterium]|nr:hypothetical protein [Desulfovibrionaceae bacterium]
MTQIQLTEDVYKEDSVYSPSFNNKTEYDTWFRKKVEAGLRDAEEGRYVSEEEMEAEAEDLCNSLIAQWKRRQ